MKLYFYFFQLNLDDADAKDYNIKVSLADVRRTSCRQESMVMILNHAFMQQKSRQLNMFSLDIQFFQDIITHPDYKPSFELNDIALLRVSIPIIFTPTIQAANLHLDLRDENSDIPLLVTGWNRGTCEFNILFYVIYSK